MKHMNENESHTPGPWIIFQNMASDAYIFSVLPAGRTGTIADNIENGYDADLIAAAPELLAHAKTVAFHLRRGDHKEQRAVSQMIDALEAIITRAEGSR